MDAERSLQIRTGVFTLAVLVALATIILFVTQEGGLFTARYRLYAHFDNIEGLTVNGPIWLAGNNVGRVSAISFLSPGSDKAVRVELDLDASVRHRVRSDSRASVGTIGLLGDKYVELTIGSELADGIDPGGVILTSESATFSELATKGRELLDNMVEISASTERMVGQFEQEMGGESLAHTVAALQRIVEEIETGDGLLHEVVYEPTGGDAITAVEDSAESLRDIMHEIREGDGLLHELIYAPEGEQAALDSIAESATRLNSVLEKIDGGEGTLGALINDPALYEDLRLLVSGAQQSTLLRTLINFVREEDAQN